MKKIFPLILFVFFVVLSLPGRASHILGGEIRMETTGQANQYSVTMIQYWDKSKLTVANKDPWVELFFYRKRDNALIYKNRIPLISTQKVTYQNDVCTQFQSLDSQVGTYNATVGLNPGDFNDPDGYYIVWERCCRNAAIGNIDSPGESGLVFYLEFAPLSIRNSSPVFSGPNGDYVCKDVPYTSNAAATDADGDELRYSLVTPFRGNTTEQAPDGTDQPKAGYPLVEWSAGKSAQNAIPGNPALRIDARTGQLTVTANQLGLFVFTVLCEEFRNGKRIGAVRRDYQSLVIECNPPPPAPVIMSDGQAKNPIQICEGQSTILEIKEPGDWLYQWYRNEQRLAGATNPRYEARETGAYKVIKTPRDQQCTGTATSQIVEVIVSKMPLAVIVQSKDALCAGQSMELRARQGDSYTYEWRRNGSVLSQTGSILSINEAGSYSLMVTDKVTGCMASTNSEVIKDGVSVDLPSQISVLRGESVTLLPNVESLFPVSYAWSPATGLSNANIAQPQAKLAQSISYILRVSTESGCTASDSVLVVVIDCSLPPESVIEHDGKGVQSVELCPQRPVRLQIEQAGDWAYQWQLNDKDISGANSENYTATQLGKYTVIKKFKKQELCPLFSVSKAVNLIAGTSPALAILGTDKALCPGGKVELRTISDTTYSYQWLFDQAKIVGSEANVSVGEVGRYQLIVTNEKNGCTARDSAVVKLDTSRIPEPIILQSGLPVKSVEFCDGNSATLEIKNPSDWAYQWFQNGKEIQGAQAGILAVRELGNYTVTRNFKDKGHCAGASTSQPVEAIVGKSPSAVISKTKEILCNSETIELNVEENASYTYAWTLDAKKLNEVNSSLTAKQGGYYRLTVINKQNGCSASDSVILAEEKIELRLPSQIIVRRGESAVLEPEVNSTTQPVNYSWTPSNGLDITNALNPIVFTDQNTNYILLATSPGGCTATDTVAVIIVDRVYIPDAFSPNGDGINDVFTLLNGKELIESIQIYDRWGNVIFYSDNYDIPWDGKSKGSNVPSGTYTYSIQTSFEYYKGSIMVLY